jgi:hypothetical protein
MDGTTQLLIGLLVIAIIIAFLFWYFKPMNKEGWQESMNMFLRYQDRIRPGSRVFKEDKTNWLRDMETSGM